MKILFVNVGKDLNNGCNKVFFKEKDRMTNKCNIFCSECPLSAFNNGLTDSGCIVNKHPEKSSRNC